MWKQSKKSSGNKKPIWKKSHETVWKQTKKANLERDWREIIINKKINSDTLPLSYLNRGPVGHLSSVQNWMKNASKSGSSMASQTRMQGRARHIPSATYETMKHKAQKSDRSRHSVPDFKCADIDTKICDQCFDSLNISNGNLPCFLTSYPSSEPDAIFNICLTRLS